MAVQFVRSLSLTAEGAHIDPNYTVFVIVIALNMDKLETNVLYRSEHPRHVRYALTMNSLVFKSF